MTNEVKSTWGGKREGSGRKNQGYKMVSIRMTEEEKEAVKEFLQITRNRLKRGDFNKSDLIYHVEEAINVAENLVLKYPNDNKYSDVFNDLLDVNSKLKD